MVAVHVVLRDFHGLKLLQTGFLGDFVLALVGIVFQMAHIGDVAHVAHLVADMGEIAEHHIEGHGRTRVSQMRLAIYRRPADIETHMVRSDWFKQFFPFA